MTQPYIDADSHVLEPEDMFEKYLEPAYRDDMPIARTGYQVTANGTGFFLGMKLGSWEFSIGEDPALPTSHLADSYARYAREGFPVTSYLDAMDRTGIDYMVLYPTTSLYTTHAGSLHADVAAAYRRAYNNWLHDFCSDGDQRLVGAGAVDLRDPEAAAREAERCVKDLGFKAIVINPAPAGAVRMSDPECDRLWATLVDLDVPLALHCAAFNGSDPIFEDYFPRLPEVAGPVAFTIGNMIASATLITGGVLDRHPTLRVVHLECGAGWAVHWPYRLKASVMGASKNAPSAGRHPVDIFREQCFVSADPDDPDIEHLIDVLGNADSIVVGSDFGHPEGWQYGQAPEKIVALDGVSDESKHKIMWENPSRLYGIGV